MQKQQRKDRLVSRLYYVSAVALLLFTAYFAMIVGFDIFQEKQLDNFRPYPNHLTGYNMSANMRVMTFDSIINFKQNTSDEHSSFGSGSVIIKDGACAGVSRAEINSVLNDTTYAKTFTVQTKKIWTGEGADANEETISLSPAAVEAYITIKPKSIWLAIILAVRNYSFMLCIIFILFQLTLLFRKLKNDFSFNSSLSRTIWKVGNCLLVYQLLLFVTGALVMQFIDGAAYYQETAGTPGRQQILTLSISFDVNLAIVFTGLSLVVLSKLLNYGYELQQESDLTI
ncbi:hypothetical protein HYN59_05610 [Flavobacterium album]|uniref:DUF2975 domain-containing protein n=1 Tax=Flavobacterium album TaxID=2175091 RepID=A0A2S1QW53_9FLAO|nr:DUF2975 domain-containing protein [Flavobacterium album]AWH84626.1 hypothetical protein HYN59_05610 [Flavobacterium album]